VAAAPDTEPASPPGEAPAPSIEPEVDAAEAPATAPLAQDVPTTTAPKLQSVKGAVIIRRGDTLWRISRRVYGRGIRYSTIYVANQKQIEDPDRIWPGQVFTVPQKTSEGVAADMTSIGEQATTLPQ
jgi:nucleoid-associated protein YgaU